jgi:cell division protein FtsN
MSLRTNGLKPMRRGGFVDRRSSLVRQRGGFAMGLIVGLLIGLALALGVALYIAKVPSPFHDKVPHRTLEQEAAEAEKLKNWDPNAGLGGKPVPPRPAPASAPLNPLVVAPAVPPATLPAVPPATSTPVSPAPRPGRDAAAILAGESPAPAPRAPAIARPGADPFIYFVQVGAYSSADDAEQQRAKLALQGIAAKVTEREQGGRTIHRLRVGPFDSQTEAVAQQDRIKAGGVDAALVRQERN